MTRWHIAPGIRHLIVGQYLTLYRISGGGIEIVRVIHGRRQITEPAMGTAPAGR